jgi:hypothetical protein
MIEYPLIGNLASLVKREIIVREVTIIIIILFFQTSLIVCVIFVAIYKDLVFSAKFLKLGIVGDLHVMRECPAPAGL